MSSEMACEADSPPCGGGLSFPYVNAGTLRLRYGRGPMYRARGGGMGPTYK